MSAMSVKDVLRIGEGIVARLSPIAAIAKEALTDPSLKNALLARYDIAGKLYIEFSEQTHIKIDPDDTDDIDKFNKLTIKIDELYFEIKAAYVHFIDVSASTPAVIPTASIAASTSGPGGASSRRRNNLPTIELPTFSGDILAYPTFYELFKKLVHRDPELDAIEKFHYLHSVLKGEASRLIQGLPLTSANYTIALQLLHDRYMNTRVIAQNHLNAIQSIKTTNATNRSSRALRLALDTFMENYKAFNAMNWKIKEKLDFVWFNMLLQKIDSRTREKFEVTVVRGEMPTLNKLADFLENQCIAIERTYDVAVESTSKDEHFKPNKSNITFQNKSCSLLANTSSGKCYLCNVNHSLHQCSIFLEKSSFDRFNVVKSNKLCLNCLRPSHLQNNCPSSFSCKICRSRHHTLLHFEKRSSSAASPSSAPSSSIVNNKDFSTPSVSLQAHSANRSDRETRSSNTVVLLATALIDVKNNNGGFSTLRAIVDSGSQSSFLSERALSKLGFKCSPCNVPIQGLSQTNTILPKGFINCLIKPKGSMNPQFELDLMVLPKICSNMPRSNINWNCDQLSNLKLADPCFGSPGSIDMLLGADVFPSILLNGRLLGGNSSPSAINTVFGWIIMGKINLLSELNTPPISSFYTLVDQSLDTTIRNFWELEKIPSKPIVSREDSLCENIFKQKYCRDSFGRFVVPLPFKEKNPSFTDSRSNALRRFLHLERRLNRDEALKQQYIDFMKDYLLTGHMNKLSFDLQTQASFYIPHHCVFKLDSTTTKLRVVFDASAKDIHGNSLNDTLFIGPKLQSDIFELLLRFRFHSIVFTADIRQMYRQILVLPEHRKYQNILWRFSPSDPIETYQLNTVTYGVSSAPFLALRTIIELARLNSDEYPNASKIALRDIYVDDLITGCQTLQEAQILRNEMIAMFKDGCFELRKWSSNCSEILEDISELSNSSLSFDCSENSFVKILGLHWQPDTDTFFFKTTPIDRLCTKRTILSELARIFDPLGFLTPLTFFAKHLIQKLWTLNLNWDDIPPPTIVRKWLQFQSQLSSLSKLHIPRRVVFDNYTSCQMHGFCDASESGYAAVIYFRISDINNKVQVFFVCAKSKVAPLSRISIPRLELAAAVLLAELIETVSNAYANILNINQNFAWSDSTVTLAWIKSHPSRWKPFVGNRVALIQEKTPSTYWNHIRTYNNPADCASRGLFPIELIKHNLWWAGPEWLLSPTNQWFSNVEENFDSVIIPKEEQRVSLIAHIEHSDNPVDNLIQKFSSYKKIQRIVSYCLRFVHNAKNKIRISGPLTAKELYKATIVLVKFVQYSVFAEDIKLIKENKAFAKPLRRLAPFLSEEGLLRVGGRLKYSDLSNDQKHPMLLPRSHRLVDLIIDQTHRDYFHPGLHTLSFLLAQTFWILSARRAIKSRISRCMRCARIHPPTVTPFMGDLPKFRVSQVKPFSHSGVDFAGPFKITMGKYRGAKTYKAYICLFVCCAVKALHLELVSELSSDAFLAALRRFVARRGRVSDLYSDCGTNFVGADKLLRSSFEKSSESLAIKWHFNPPGAPHFGGLWEAGVKSVKTHLIRVVGLQVLTYEELNTTLIQIESLLNSRPLSALSSDPSDLSVLTPGHFLTLEALTAPPDDSLETLKLSRLSRWQLLQRMHQDFWRRWHLEYLHTLQQRNKWSRPTINLKKDSLVVIKQENVPPLRWSLGRVVDLHPGKDGVARVATVRTVGGIIQRPIVKLCPLPIS